MTKIFETFLPDEEAQLAFGARLALLCVPPCVIFLYGDLGAGKTTLVRGFMRGLGYEGRVKSPSYTLVEEYELLGKSVFHFDFYRIEDPHELDFMGIQEYSQPSAILLMEWPEKAAGLLPVVDLCCRLKVSESGRYLCLEAGTKTGEALVSSLLC